MKDLRYIPSWEDLKKYKLVKLYRVHQGKLVELLSCKAWSKYIKLMSIKGHFVENIDPDVASSYISKEHYEYYRNHNIRQFDSAHDTTLSSDAIHCLGQIGDDDLN